MAYTYDLVSKITQVVDPTGTYSFSYDNMGRLTGTTTAYAFLTGRNFTTSYTYNAASNRAGFTDPESGSTSYSYDTLNRRVAHPSLAVLSACRRRQPSGWRTLWLFGRVRVLIFFTSPRNQSR